MQLCENYGSSVEYSFIATSNSLYNQVLPKTRDGILPAQHFMSIQSIKSFTTRISCIFTHNRTPNADALVPHKKIVVPTLEIETAEIRATVN